MTFSRKILKNFRQFDRFMSTWIWDDHIVIRIDENSLHYIVTNMTIMMI